MAHMSMMILAMMSVDYDGPALGVDGDVDLAEVVEAFGDFVECLRLIPAEVKAQRPGRFSRKFHPVAVISGDAGGDGLKGLVVEDDGLGDCRRNLPGGGSGVGCHGVLFCHGGDFGGG